MIATIGACTPGAWPSVMHARGSHGGDASLGSRLSTTQRRRRRKMKGRHREAALCFRNPAPAVEPAQNSGAAEIIKNLKISSRYIIPRVHHGRKSLWSDQQNLRWQD